MCCKTNKKIKQDLLQSAVNGKVTLWKWYIESVHGPVCFYDDTSLNMSRTPKHQEIHFWITKQDAQKWKNGTYAFSGIKGYSHNQPGSGYMVLVQATVNVKNIIKAGYWDTTNLCTAVVNSCEFNEKDWKKTYVKA